MRGLLVLQDAGSTIDRSVLHNEAVAIKEELLIAKLRDVERIHIECVVESLITLLNTKTTLRLVGKFWNGNP